MNNAGEIMETIDFDSLDDFWAALSPIGDKFSALNRSYIYRGQRDSKWELVPQVYRQSVIDRYKRGMLSTLKDHTEQTVFEFWILRSFMHYCDMKGLAIPGDSMQFREYFTLPTMSMVHGISNTDWPQLDVFPLMAMAQHHGIPTRLLDWSYNSTVAAYFAAAGVVNDCSPIKGRRLAVFGLSLNQNSRRQMPRVVRVPGSTSPNLSAQNGCFVLVHNSGVRGQIFTPDVTLESQLDNHDHLIKLTLPVELAGELLLRCHQFSYSAASIFPGYDGAARAALEDLLAQSMETRLVDGEEPDLSN